MKNLLGVMQGRLSPPRNERIQSFPLNSWREEFVKAQICGLDLIEWVFEADQWDKNPLMSDAGLEEIKRLGVQTGVRVLSVCADYFMDLPLLRVSSNEQTKRVGMLKNVIGQCAKAGVRYIEIPFVDNSAIQTPMELEDVSRCIKDCALIAQSNKISLCLETSLAPEPFAQLLSRIDHPAVKVNYDIGNSASLGYDTSLEFAAYGPSIATVHIKDRIRGGSTVPLGTGNANFKTTFSGLSQLQYQGPLIFQSARQGEEIETLRCYIEFIKPYLNPLEVSLN